MTDTSIKKLNAGSSPVGDRGQKYLVSGTSMAMRLWEVAAGPPTPEPTRREYETVGYVISGRATLELEGQQVTLEPGDSWLVPRDALHRYQILEDLVAGPPASA